MKRTTAVLCLVILLLPLPGLILNRPDLIGADREENVNRALGLRGEMLSAHAALSRVLGMSGSGQVALGKRGTLFLSETLPEAVGAETLSDDEIEAIAGGLKALDDHLRGRGAYLIFLCAPSKANILTEDLPYYALPRSGESALEKLLGRLAALGVRYVDAGRLAEGLGEGAYLRTDTHWSDALAGEVYRALMMELPAAAHETYQDAAWETEWETGDLTALIDPVYGGKEAAPRRALERTYRVQGLLRTVMDPRIETACGRNDLQVLLLRDSFANALFPYLANNIGSLRLIRAARWEEDFWREGTDAVILEIAERNLRTLAEAPPI